MDAPIMKSSRKIVHPGPSSDFASVWGQLQKQNIKRQFNHKGNKKAQATKLTCQHLVSEQKWKQDKL